jgi:hypothetical protein
VIIAQEAAMTLRHITIRKAFMICSPGSERVLIFLHSFRTAVGRCVNNLAAKFCKKLTDFDLVTFAAWARDSNPVGFNALLSAHEGVARTACYLLV